MATKSVKVENYTEAQAAEMLQQYDPQASAEVREAQVKQFAVTYGKTVRSIVAKLSRLQVYVPKAYVSKTGEKPVRKNDHADAIGVILRLTENETDSLSKANKTALVKIFSALANSKPLENGEARAGE